MSETPIAVLLAHGLPADAVASLRESFRGVEAIAASLSRHESGQCENADERGCPWHTSTPVGDVATVTAAVNAWTAVGWLERGLLSTPSDDDRPPPQSR